MKFRYSIILLLFLPLTLTGCIFNKNNEELAPAEAEIKYNVYQSEKLGEFYFSAKYLDGWTVQENSTEKFDEFKDEVIFKGELEEITVNILDKKEQQTVLDLFNIETQAQTEVNTVLGNRILGSLKDDSNKRWEVVLVESSSYLIVIKTDYPASPDYSNFLNDFSFAKLADQAVKPKSDVITLKLYFDNNQSDDFSCEAKAVKTVTIRRTEEDLGLIPQVVKLLIQLSIPEDLAKEGLLTAIPVNTRLYSFGYENNKAIVNFNAELNEGGGSCLMLMRRSQIENTIKALNEVSGLQIREVEIQVEGETDTALQP